MTSRSVRCSTYSRTADTLAIPSETLVWMCRSALPTGMRRPEVLSHGPLARIALQVSLEQRSKPFDGFGYIAFFVLRTAHSERFFDVDNKAVAIDAAGENREHHRVGLAGYLPWAARKPYAAAGKLRAEPVALQVAVAHKADEPTTVEHFDACANALEVRFVELAAGGRTQLSHVAGEFRRPQRFD